MAKNKKSNKQKQNKSQQGEQPIEQKVLKYFKQIPSSDIDSVKDLTKKVMEKIKRFDEEMEDEQKKAREEAKAVVKDAHDKAKTIKDDAHKSAEKIKETAMDQGKKEADELKEAMTVDLNQAIEEQNLKTEKLNEIEQEYLEKSRKLDEKEAELKQYLADRIEKDHDAFDKRVKEYEKKYQTDLDKKTQALEKVFKQRVESLIDGTETSFNTVIKELGEKLATQNELKELKGTLATAEKRVEFYQNQLRNYPPEKHEELNLKLEAATEKVALYEKQLKEKTTENIRLEKDITRLNIDKDIVQKYEKLLKEKTLLEDRLAQLPSTEMIEYYKQQVRDVEHLQDELEEKQREIIRLNSEVSKHKINKETSNHLENANRAYKVLYDKLTEDYRKLEEGYQNTVSARFKGLVQIDEKYSKETHQNTQTSATVDLKQFCEDFRNFLAAEKKMYYDERTVRCFIAGMAVSKLIVLEGLSGTGKSRLPQEFSDFINQKANLIRVQPSWRDRNELIGYYNEFTKTFRETDFLKVWYEALHNPSLVHVVVLDEMNLARVEYYFADFLSELEKENIQDRQVELIGDTSHKDPIKLINGKLHIPENIWFVGTINKDESTFALSDKVYDRAISIRFKKKGEIHSGKQVLRRFVDADELKRAFEAAKGKQRVDDKLLDGVAYIDEFMQVVFGVNFGNRIQKQLEDYLPVYQACGGSAIEAFDGFLERKILRKLEGNIGEGLKKKYDDLMEALESTFGNQMTKSIEYISELKEKVF